MIFGPSKQFNMTRQLARSHALDLRDSMEIRRVFGDPKDELLDVSFTDIAAAAPRRNLFSQDLDSVIACHPDYPTRQLV